MKQMKLKFLGTGAATACPLPFCNCQICKDARKFGGKDFRKRSSILINDDLIIDMGRILCQLRSPMRLIQQKSVIGCKHIPIQIILMPPI